MGTEMLEKQEIGNEKDKKGYTYDEAMELTGHGRYNYLLLTACSIITMAVSLDMFGFSIVVAAAKCDLQLGMIETGILASTPFSGVLFACPWGYYADTRGRRKALVYSTIIGFIFASISSLSPNWQFMMVFKIIASSFSNASFTLTMTMLGECTGTSRRSSFLFIMISINLVAEVFSFGLAYFILPLQFSPYIPVLNIYYSSWRLFTFTMALPLVIGGMLMANLYESPKFLASRGEVDKALEVLKNIYEINGGKRLEYPVQHILLSEEEGATQKLSFLKSFVHQTVPLFQKPYLWRTLQIFYLFAVCSSTNNAFVMWYPTIVNYFFNSVSDGGWTTDQTFCQRIFGNDSVSIKPFADESFNESCDATLSTFTILSGVFYGAFFCIITLAGSLVAKHKKLLLISWLFISAISLLLVDIRQPLASLAFFILFQISALGVPSLASYCVDLFPTTYRAMVTSLAMMVARMFSLSGVNIVGAVITDHCSITFYTWSIFVFSAILLCFLLPTERKINNKK